MSVETSAKTAITKLRKKIDQGVFQEVDPAFLVFLENIFGEVSHCVLPDESISKPTSINEGLALTHSSFFSGNLKQPNSDITSNDFLKSLMVESSARLRDWLILREIVGKHLSYNLIIWTYLQNLDKDKEKLPKSFKSDIEPQGIEYLKNFDIPIFLQPMAKIMEMKLRGTEISEVFWRSRINSLMVSLGTGNFQFGPSQVSNRRQANVITHTIFRSSDLENMHSGIKKVTSKSLTQLERFVTFDMKDWLVFMDALKGTRTYASVVLSYWATNCSHWEE